MATDGHTMSRGRGSRWTLLIWGGAAVLLSLPFFAMRLQADGVNWTASDFIVMGVMLGIVCGTIELAVRLTGSWAYRFGVIAAIASAFLITWANLAVGIVGSENNPANGLFFAALLVGFVGAIAVGFRPAGMAVVMLTTIAAIAVAFIIAAAGVTDEPNVTHLRELVATAVISSPLLLSAWFFRRAARS
jgi:hypothetical protein